MTSLVIENLTGLKCGRQLRNGLLAVLFTGALVAISKPSFMYQKIDILDNSIGHRPKKTFYRTKQFGTSKNETLFPIWLACATSGVIFYFTSLIIYN